jgi:Major Facilitator Superfamily
MGLPEAATAPQPLPPATRRAILLLSFGTFSSMVAQRICDAMLPELSRVFAVGLPQAAQVVSVFAITYGLSQLFYGPLGDRLGKFRVVTFATLGCCIGSVLAMLAATLPMLLVARVLMALGAAALIPLAMAWVGDNVPADQLQEMLTRTGLGSTLGIVGGQLVGGLLTDALGWRWAFGFMTVLFGVVGSLMWRDLRQQQRAARQSPDGSADVNTTAAPRRPGFVVQAASIITGPWSRVVLLMALVEGAVGHAVVVGDHAEDDRQRDIAVVHAAVLAALGKPRVDRLPGLHRGHHLALVRNDDEEDVGRDDGGQRRAGDQECRATGKQMAGRPGYDGDIHRYQAGQQLFLLLEDPAQQVVDQPATDQETERGQHRDGGRDVGHVGVDQEHPGIEQVKHGKQAEARQPCAVRFPVEPVQVLR